MRDLLFRWREPKTVAQLRAVVAGIRREDLITEARCFADAARKTQNKRTRAMHWAKFMAAMDRIESELK